MNEYEQKAAAENLQAALERTEQRLAELESHEKRRRRERLIAWLAVLALIIGGVCVHSQDIAGAVDTIKQAELVICTVGDMFEDVDIDNLSSNITVFANADNEKLKSFVTVLGKVDFDSLGEQLDSLNSFADKLSKFDANSIGSTLETLQKIIGPLKELFGA